MGTALSELLAQAAYGKSAWKLACRTVATANVTLSGLQTIGGVALAVGDRVLVTGQANAAQNGPYTVSSGAWSRGIDFDTASDVQYGSRFAITDGTAAGQSWRMTSPASGPIALGATLLSFARIPDGGWIASAIDANHLYVYEMQEGAGSTTLLNTGSASGGNLSRVGSDFDLSQRRIVGASLFGYNKGGLPGGLTRFEGAVDVQPSAGYSIECFVVSDKAQTFSSVGLTFLHKSNGVYTDGIYQGITNGSSTAKWNCGRQLASGSNVGFDTTAPFQTIVYGKPEHLMVVYDVTAGQIRQYRNGLLTNQATATGAMPALQWFQIGCWPPGPFEGYISQVRVSNIARSASYAIERANNCFGINP